LAGYNADASVLAFLTGPPCVSVTKKRFSEMPFCYEQCRYRVFS